MGKNFQDVIRDVYNEGSHALQTTGGSANSTVFIGNPTLYAVVNTGGSSTGNPTLNAGPNYIGFVTIDVGTIKAWPDPKSYIGSASVNIDPNPILGTGFPQGLFISTVSGNAMNVNLKFSDGKQAQDSGGNLLVNVQNFGIGTFGNSDLNAPNTTSALVFSYGFSANPSLIWERNRTANAANATTGTGLPGIGALGFDGTNYQRISTDTGGQVKLGDPKTYVGLTTTTIGNSPVLGAGVNNIGFATVKVDSGTQFIGLVTAWNRNAGTTKVLASIPVAMSTNSIATIAVPTNANTVYVTSLLLNSDATVRINILSGVTYLNGNVTIGITLNPGGGWVETGAPDSPTYIGNPSGAIIIQKLDLTGTIAKISGKVVYFQE